MNAKRYLARVKNDKVMSTVSDEPLLDKNFLMNETFKDWARHQKHIEQLGVRVKRHSYSAMRNAEHDPERTNIFSPVIKCSLGEFSIMQLVTF